MMANLNLTVTLPDRLMAAFLQHLRDFDAAHLGDLIIRLWIMDSDLTREQVRAIFANIRPPFSSCFEIPFSKTRGNS
jgi:hypothetical protein